MAITVSPPEAGRLSVQKLAAYRLHLAASEAYLRRHPPIRTRGDLKAHRLIGYIPDMIFDKELDYMAELGEGLPVKLESNSASVQLNWVRQGAGIAIVHDFAIPAAPGVRRVLAHDFALERTFYLIRHADDRRVERLNRFADELVARFRKEVQRLEGIS